MGNPCCVFLYIIFYNTISVSSVGIGQVRLIQFLGGQIISSYTCAIYAVLLSDNISSMVSLFAPLQLALAGQIELQYIPAPGREIAGRKEHTHLIQFGVKLQIERIKFRPNYLIFGTKIFCRYRKFFEPSILQQFGK